MCGPLIKEETHRVSGTWSPWRLGWGHCLSELGLYPQRVSIPAGEEALEKGWVVSGASLVVPCVLCRDCMIWSYPWSWVSNRVRS